MVTEDGRALGAGVSCSMPDPGSWVTLGVTVDVWSCPVSAAGCRPGRAHFGGGFPGLGKPGERRLVTAQGAAREGNRRQRIQSKAGGLSGNAPGWGSVGSGRAPPDQSPFRGVVPAPDLRFCPTVHGPSSSGAASSCEE